MPDAARSLAQSLLDSGWQYVTVDPYAWNEQALRGWAKAGKSVEGETSGSPLMFFKTSRTCASVKWALPSKSAAARWLSR